MVRLTRGSLLKKKEPRTILRRKSRNEIYRFGVRIHKAVSSVLGQEVNLIA